MAEAIGAYVTRQGRMPMRHATLGPLGPVSRLTLGGGGIGQIWGEVSAEEAGATLAAALDGGIDVLDAAPGYRNCETFIGEVFDGRPAGRGQGHHQARPRHRPARRGRRPAGGVAGGEPSAMRLAHVDLFFLHTNISPRRLRLRPRRRPPGPGGDQLDRSMRPRWSRRWSSLGPAGRIGAWGDHRHRRAGRDPGGAGAEPKPAGGAGDRQPDGQRRRRSTASAARPGHARSSPPPRPPAPASWASARCRPAR